MASAPPLALGARCALHPEASAVATCSRCGTFLCPGCTEVLGEAASCAPCLEWVRREAPPSRLVQVCIALGVLGVVTWPLSMPVPVLNVLATGLGGARAVVELRRIRRGEASLKGRTQARVALGLACVNGGLLLLSLALLAFMAWMYWDGA